MLWDHPSPRTLRCFAEGRLPASRGARIVRHLLQGCDRCGALLARLTFADSGDGENGYVEAFRRVRELVERRQREEASDVTAAERQWAAVSRKPLARQGLFLRSDPRSRHPHIVERLIATSKANLSADIAAARASAELAADVADLLDEDRFGDSLVADLQARSRTAVARAYRRSGDLARAQEALAAAQEAMERGTGDPAEAGAVLDELGLLRANQRRFDEALAALDGALAAHRQTGDRHLVGRSLVNKAIILGQAAEPHAAIRLLREALALIDAKREPRWLLAIHHNLALYHADAGLLGEALRCLHAAEPLYRELGRPADLLKLRWTWARVHFRRGDLEAAAEELEAVREGFLRLELPCEAAMVSLELALVYAEQGRAGQLTAVALDALPVFALPQRVGETLATLLERRASGAPSWPPMLRVGAGARAPIPLSATRSQPSAGSRLRRGEPSRRSG